MAQSFFNKLMSGGSSKPSQAAHAHAASHTHVMPNRSAQNQKAVYSKVFRWHHGPGEHDPKTIEIVGSFTDWRPVPLAKTPGSHGTWQATIENIPGGKTHHYMLLMDGKPHADKHCDGYAVPLGPQEERYALDTPRGPRLFLLFAQAK